MINLEKLQKVAGKIENNLSFIWSWKSDKPDWKPSFLQVFMYWSIWNIIARIIMENFFRDGMIFINNSSVLMLYGMGILIWIVFFFLFELVIFKIVKI